MHMSDALISPTVGGVMWAASSVAAVYSLKKIHNDDSFERKIPLMGVMGAFVFAGQMVNFTIPGTGSSGHICGAIILSAMLGKYAGFLTLSVILSIQALFFADGGLLALGSNIFNIGLLSCLAAYPLIFKPIVGETASNKRIIAASITASVVGLQLGSFAVVLETFLSGKTELPFAAFILIMQPVHFIIGLCEGLITAALLVFLNNHASETIADISGKNERIKPGAAVLVIIAVLCAGGILPMFASQYPDGLEWSVEKLLGGKELSSDGELHEVMAGIQERTSFMPDYASSKPEVSVSLPINTAGVMGSAITFGFILALCLLLVGKKRKKGEL